MLFHKIMDALNGIEQIANGVVMVKGVDNIRNVFAHIYLNEPISVIELGTSVNKVCTEDLIKGLICVSLVKLFKSN